MSQQLVKKLRNYIEESGTVSLLDYFGYSSSSAFYNWARDGVPKRRKIDLERFFEGVKNGNAKKGGKRRSA